MLGNFSVGDYFRDEVLTWAYELLFSEEWFGFDKDLIYITYYTNDLDTFNKWTSLGISKDHLIPLMDNFWEIGDGPCGPDTEIFFDRGTKYDPENIGIKLLKEDIENDRYIEIWNIVFSQFNSESGKKRSEYKELPCKNIDTGSGLERLACVMQETETNYETDLFMPYIKFIEEHTGIKYNGQMAFKVIVDHIRSITFAVADGAVFSNTGRGYVLRRILRRAVRFARQLNIKEAFLYKLVDVVAKNMEEYYPYLHEKKELVARLIKIEEENFWKTLEKGERKLNEIIQSSKTDTICAADAFLLYDTFGFPIELTLEAAEEQNMKVDVDGFKEYLQMQKNRARLARSNAQSMNIQNEDYLKFKEESIFVGYESLHVKSNIIGLFKDGKKENSARGDLVIVSKETPFYAESGGQIGDIGSISVLGNEIKVLNTFKMPNGQHAMVIDSDDLDINVGDSLKLDVDEGFRYKVAKNHSATHLLNQSLRNILGNHVVQQGSLNTDKRLRFDFNHYATPTVDEILQIEELTNKAIQHNYKVKTIITTLDEAKKHGAQALFGEKYGSVVRMVDMDYSLELCGGTHVKETKEIEKFVILSVESKGSGIYRVEAATSSNVESELSLELANNVNSINDLLSKIDELLERAKKNGIDLSYKEIKLQPLKYSYIDIINRRNELQEIQKQYRKLSIDFDNQMKNKESNQTTIDLSFENVNGIDYSIKVVENISIDTLKFKIDEASNQSDKCVLFVADIIGEKIIFISKIKNTPFNAGELVKAAAIICGGNGGGRPDFAQAGGKNINKVNDAINEIKSKVM